VFKPHDAHRYLQQRWHKVLHELADPTLPVSERPKKYAPPTTNKGWGASKLLHQVLRHVHAPDACMQES
jgi:hypothetical protein